MKPTGYTDAMANANPLNWKLKLMAEIAPGEHVEVDVGSWERPVEVSLATLGLSLEEGKKILAEIQHQMVTTQMEQRAQADRRCADCGRSRRNKGCYRSTFHSAYGKVPVRVRRVLPCRHCGHPPAVPLFTRKSCTSPELLYLDSKLSALAPFAKVADFLNEVLPATARSNAATVRNRTRRVGRRLMKDLAETARAARAEPAETLVIGVDGGYVRSRRTWERNFEVTVAKLTDEDGECIRVAFEANQYYPGVRQICHGLEVLGVNDKTEITVWSDGDAGLRTLQYDVAPRSEHILDWFHIGMRFEHLLDACQAVEKGVPMARHVSAWAHFTATHAKWALWNGQAEKTFGRLEALRMWTSNEPEPTPEVHRVHKHATDLLNYLRANQDSLPNYEERYNNGEPISTGPVESAVNEIIAKRMCKSQQMSWNRWKVQPFLTVRCAVLNETLEDSFREWFPGFRPAEAEAQGRRRAA